MKPNYYMSDEDFEKFLEEIGGVENGYFTDRPPITKRGAFGVGNGWLGIIKEMLEDIIKMGWNKQTVQIKEKFGGLRFYINSASEEVHNRISEAEKLSYKVCEECGEEGELRQDLSWWTTLCDTHYNERKNKK
jgi:hypothetical protein